MNGTRNVAILVFDDVEVLDFCGPFEVFSTAKLPGQEAPFHVYTCGETTLPVWARNRLSINPQYPLHTSPAADILVVPGGWGTRELMTNERVIEWIRKTAANCEMVLSVCTGALVLAKAGLLDGLRATTHHEAIPLLREVAPRSTITSTERFVDNGRVVVAAGISAGIDASLHVVARLLGKPAALASAQYMEYDWKAAA